MIFQIILIIIGYLMYYWHKKIRLPNFKLETITNTLLYLYVSNYGGLVKMQIQFYYFKYFSVLSKKNVSSQSYIQQHLNQKTFLLSNQ
ncbi:unnamed protein product [Paramecium sonneborni]|uniref:Uncharacterized protein n=1 Tax=Paramecium sonneborni TaxID=65129 RepID=A0A8S1RN62_9CILI|nr:unnamed protein product [Paramecium sonneborni]